MSAEVIEAEVVEPDAPSELVPVNQPPPSLFGTQDPDEAIRLATAKAKVAADVIRKRKLISNIQGKEHVQVEGWTTLGSLLGVVPVTAWTQEVTDGEGNVIGYKARVEARTLAGAIVGAAESRCMRSERNWKTRDDYALESMAQTRATSKALRQPLGFVMVLAGYNPTPAEELTEPAGGNPTTETTTSSPPPAETSAEQPVLGEGTSGSADQGGEGAEASGSPPAEASPPPTYDKARQLEIAGEVYGGKVAATRAAADKYGVASLNDLTSEQLTEFIKVGME